jgi:hypothetical protein
MSTKNGVFRDLTGIRFEKPRPTNPYKTWDPDEKRGFRGLFSTCGEFFLSDQDCYYYPPGFFFNGPEKAIKAPKAPFGHRLGAESASVNAADTNTYQDHNYAE